MRTEQETLSLIETARHQRNIPSDRQEEIWNKIEIRMSQSSTSSKGMARKWRMSSRLLTSGAALIVTLLLVMAGTYGVMRHQSGTTAYENNALLQELPGTDRQALLKIFDKANFRVEFPTKLPFKLQHGHGNFNQTGGQVDLETIDIWVGNTAQTLEIMEVGSQLSSNHDGVHVSTDGTLVTLSNGLNAYFQRSASYSRLTWSKDGVYIDLLSSKPDNSNKQTGEKPGLTESQLVKIAESFK